MAKPLLELSVFDWFRLNRFQFFITAMNTNHQSLPDTLHQTVSLLIH